MLSSGCQKSYDCSRLSHTLGLSFCWAQSYSRRARLSHPSMLRNRRKPLHSILTWGERIIPMKFKVPTDYPSPQMLVSCVKALQRERKGSGERGLLLGTGIHGIFNLQLKDSGTLLCLSNGSLIRGAYVLVTLKILWRVYDELAIQI